MEKRFGTIAIEKGFITKDQLIEGLEAQVQAEIEGLEHRFIGATLYDLGYMTISQVNEVIESKKTYNEAIENLVVLREINIALVEAVRGAILLLEKKEDLSEEKRVSVIDSLKRLMERSEQVYENAPAKD
jgi:hypothetical protein